MNKYILLCCLFESATYSNWNFMIQKYKHLLNAQETMILNEQYQAFIDQTLPSIADQRIKAIAINECGEILIDINKTNNHRIKMLPNPQFPFQFPDCNAGFQATSKVRLQLYQKLVDLIHTLDQLAPYFDYQTGEISIQIFEGLRDIETQKRLFDNKFHEIALMHPDFPDEKIFTETCKWVSPVINNIPVHSTGAAVDLRLFDEQTEQFVDMGKFGVIWGTNPTAPTFSNNITDDQIKNRLWLYLAALKCGIINYPYEFWHFSIHDRYAVYWTHPKLMESIYNTIDSDN